MTNNEEVKKVADNLKELPSIQWLIGYFSNIHDESIERFIKEELATWHIKQMDIAVLEARICDHSELCQECNDFDEDCQNLILLKSQLSDLKKHN